MPAASRHRRRFFRASRLSCAAKEYLARSRPARRRHSRLCQSSVAALSQRAATRGAGRLGHAGSGDVSPRRLRRLSKRPRIRRRSRRAACAHPEIRRRLRLRQRYKRAGYEADDFLAAAASAEERRGGTVLVASGDRDAFQLASAQTTILYPVRAGEMARNGPKQVRERYGVEPKQVPDFIALRGDPSDKLPGAPGVGAGGAAALLQKYGSLAAILKAGRFPKLAEELRLYREIATMNRKAPVPRLADQTPTWARAGALARTWQLNQLAERLGELAKAQTRKLQR